MEPRRAHQQAQEAIAGQLTLDEALQGELVDRLQAGQRPQEGELERLGDSDAFGVVLVEVLEQNGWSVHPIRTPFTGDDVALVAARGPYEAHGAGATLTKAAIALVSEISTYYGVRPLRAA